MQLRHGWLLVLLVVDVVVSDDYRPTENEKNRTENEKNRTENCVCVARTINIYIRRRQRQINETKLNGQLVS